MQVRVAAVLLPAPLFRHWSYLCLTCEPEQERAIRAGQPVRETGRDYAALATHLRQAHGMGRRETREVSRLARQNTPLHIAVSREYAPRRGVRA